MVTVLVHINDSQSLEVSQLRGSLGVVIHAEHDTDLFFSNKAHAQVWLADALRQVNNIGGCRMPEEE